MLVLTFASIAYILRRVKNIYARIVGLGLVGLHSDGRTTKGRITYNRTTNDRTKSAMVCTTCYYVCGSLILKGDGMTGHFLRCSSQL